MPSSSSATCLLELGHVFKKGVLSRPSLVVKSPYVADIQALPFDQASASRNPFLALSLRNNEDGRHRRLTAREKRERREELNALVADLKAKDGSGGELAHAPSLDCAGMLVSGSNCYVKKNAGSHTKTAWSVQLCEEQRSATRSVLVGYHPYLAEKIAQSMLSHSSGLLKDDLGEVGAIAKQRTFGNSRVDFVLEGKGKNSNTLTLLEVKNVVGAEYELGSVPFNRSPVGVYQVPRDELPAPGECHAIFPHGSLKPGIGVVSDRAIKHVHELGELQGTMDEETGRLIQTAILFVVNRSDTTAFRPAHEACPMFAQTLKQAQSKGTKLIAREVVWKLDKVKGNANVLNVSALAGKKLPVRFHPSVTEDIDKDHLERILKYNAEVPKTRSPPRTPVKKNKKNKKIKEEDSSSSGTGACTAEGGVRRSARKRIKV